MTNIVFEGRDLSRLFDGEEMISHRWESKITDELILDYLRYLSHVAAWIEFNAGNLFRMGSLTHETWLELHEYVFQFWVRMPRSRPVVLLFIRSTEKGMTSLYSAALDHEMSQEYPDFLYRWFDTIIYQLEPYSRLGIGGRSCRDNESQRLLRQLIPIAGMMRSEGNLRKIARYRYPGDEEAQEMYFKEHKNW